MPKTLATPSLAINHHYVFGYINYFYTYSKYVVFILLPVSSIIITVLFSTEHFAALDRTTGVKWLTGLCRHWAHWAVGCRKLC